MIHNPLLVVTFQEDGYWLAQGVNLDVCTQADEGGDEASALANLVQCLVLTHESAVGLGMEPFNWGAAPQVFAQLYEGGEPVEFTPEWDYEALPCPRFEVRRVGVSEEQREILNASREIEEL